MGRGSSGIYIKVTGALITFSECLSPMCSKTKDIDLVPGTILCLALKRPKTKDIKT